MYADVKNTNLTFMIVNNDTFIKPGAWPLASGSRIIKVLSYRYHLYWPGGG